MYPVIERYLSCILSYILNSLPFIQFSPFSNQHLYQHFLANWKEAS